MLKLIGALRVIVSTTFSVRAYNLVPFPIAMVILCLVPFIACLGGIPTPVIRAMMSNVVDPDEQGGEYLMCS